jgi:hypothetical protein
MNKIHAYSSSPTSLTAAEKRIATKYKSVTWNESFQGIWAGLEKL